MKLQLFHIRLIDADTRKLIYVSSMTSPSQPPSPKKRGRRNKKIIVLLPSPCRRGAGGEVKTALVKLTLICLPKTCTQPNIHSQ
ncbi:hypothetical protein NIES4103_42940 [Nostoc sp. NIES-4103]|nr:hypothetical protein NIES4103_42940 [Nostoc sp. NIES-4103]